MALMKASKNLMKVVTNTVSADDNNSQGQQDELGTSTNFLFGATSRYGRAVLGEAGSHIKRGGMLVVSLGGVNLT